MTAQAWITVLADLLAGAHTGTGDPLDAGAELTVTDLEGTVVFSAALARMHRIDDTGDLPTLWLRPVLTTPPTELHGPPRVVLVACRRRALTFTGVRTTAGAGLEFDLANGQVASIRPAAGANLAALQAFDDLAYNELDPAELTALEALREDSL